MYRRIVMLSSSQSSSPRQLFDHADKGTVILQNAENDSPSNTASRPGRLEPSVALLAVPQIL
jgi:hypothetical protein